MRRGKVIPLRPTTLAGAADGTVAEKAAQQGVRLPGDYLQVAGEGQQAGRGSAETVGVGRRAAAALGAAAQRLAAQWQQLADEVLAPAVQHSSPLLRAAALAVLAGLSPAAFAALPQPLQLRLLGWCSAAAAGDEASPVRAAAAKALGALGAAPALCVLPGGEWTPAGAGCAARATPVLAAVHNP